MRQKKLSSINIFFILLIAVFFGNFLVVKSASADLSTRGCVTNTMKAGEFCNWAEGKSWCAGGTATCAVESTAPCPANPTGGSYTFSCNSNSCVLSCTPGTYTLCGGTCQANTTAPSGCNNYNQCNGVCSGCSAGYDLSGNSCVAATLKLGSSSVAGASVIQGGADSRLFVGGSNVSIGSSTLAQALSVYGGNIFINDAAITSGTPNAAITKTYLDSALSAYSSSNSLWQLSGSNLFASSTSWNVGIGTTGPNYKLDVVGDIHSSGVLTEKKVVFTPTTIGWYRISAANGPFNSNQGGVVKIYSGYDNKVTDVELQYNIGGYGTNGAIQQTRYSSYNSGVVSQARISSDGSGSHYLDVYVDSATTPGPITIYGYGLNMPNFIASPVVGAAAGSTNVNTLTLGHGFRSTAGANFAETSGNVGIGTNTPGAKLDVWGNLKADSGKITTDGSGNMTFESFMDRSNVLYKLDPSSAGTSLNVAGSIYSAGGIIGMSGAGSNYMTGSLGVGTTVPTQKLTVTDSLSITNTGGSQSLLMGNQDSAGVNNPAIISVANGAFSLGHGSSWSGSGGTLTRNLYLSNAGGLSLGTYASSLNDAGAGNIIVSGSVGVGTISPQVKLDVKGKLQADNSGTYSTTYSWAGGTIQTNSLELMDKYGGSTSDGVYPTLTFHDYGNGGAQFSMEGSSTTLHLGSGQSNSAGTLAVAGSYFSKLKIWGALETTGLIKMSGSPITQPEDVINKSYLTSALAAYGSTNNLWQLSGSNLFASSTSWVVGIGTTNTSGARLEVNGSLLFSNTSAYPNSITTTDSALGNFIIQGAMGSNDNWKIFGDGTSNAGIMHIRTGDDDTEPIYFEQGTNVRMAVGSNGYIGIGTASPSASLDVVNKVKITSGGTIYNTDSSRYLDMTGTLTDSLKISGNVYTTAGLFKSDSAGSNYMMGNLGIGTSGPGYRLEVTGNTSIGGKAFVAGNSNEIWTQPQVNGTAALYVNYRGYADATSQFRDLIVSNGKGGNLAYFSGSSSSVGIGTTVPRAKLDIWGNLNAGRVDSLVLSNAGSIDNSATALYMGYQEAGLGFYGARIVQKSNPSATRSSDLLFQIHGGPADNLDTSWVTPLMIQRDTGNVGIGTTGPGSKLHVNGGVTVTNGNLVMSGGNITGVTKLSVSTIDPLYSIKGIKYSTFASAIAGGVKEEATGKLKINSKIDSEYQAIIDFDKEKEGSDLWVWRKVIDFNKSSVEAQITPYGGFANVYYYVSGNSLIFRSDRPVEISYRLIAKRFDWKEWPTLAHDQTEKAGLIIK